MLIFYVFLIFMIIAALVATETKKLLSSVICVGAIGFGSSIMFLFLKAPDIAITQIVVEVLALIILIRATIARDLTFISGDREFFAVIVSIVIVVVIFMVGITIFQTLPQFGEPVFAQVTDSASKAYISDGLQDTGAANLVSSVILDYRAYDTLGEVTVLFTCILGALVVLRKPSKKAIEEIEK
ncbi:MAG: hydrogen gas-evolving membrane-bound hydrogenase subunit E [Planctomycetota bacterium]